MEKQGEKAYYFEFQLQTLSKQLPEVVVDNVAPTQDSITFEVNATDVDEVGSITAIELYKGETLVEALNDLSVREFTGLLSNNAYTIKATYTYDLNDGVGSQTLVIEHAATTIAQAIPEVVIDNVVPTQESISFGITVTDVDQVGAVSAIELYKGETLIEALTDLSLREFTGLLSNNEYTIKVTYTYDLNDGVGSQTLTIIQTGTTIAKATPTVVIDNVVPTQTSIGFGITVTDVDQVGEITAIELYKGETLVEAVTDLSVREFLGLLSNNEYTIKVTYTYDLNDGIDSQTLTINQAATTAAKATPIVVIDNMVSTTTTIAFSITTTDTDVVGAVSAIELYKGETLVEALTDLNVREFTNLLSNNEYTIKVTYTYDLNDGNGLIESLFLSHISTRFIDGLGTELYPYLIRNTDQFFAINMYSSAHYRLVNDLDFYGIQFNPINNFSGVFDGNGFTIKNITYSEVFGISAQIGIFRNTSNIGETYAEIKNLSIENILFNISSTHILQDNGHFGLLVGYNNGYIHNVRVSGTLNISADRYFYGAVAGYNNGIIKDSVIDLVYNDLYVR